MALNELLLQQEIETELNASGLFDTNNAKAVQIKTLAAAISKAVVTHIRTNAEVTGTAAGGLPVTGRVM